MLSFLFMFDAALLTARDTENMFVTQLYCLPCLNPSNVATFRTCTFHVLFSALAPNCRQERLLVTRLPWRPVIKIEQFETSLFALLDPRLL